jgi:hypothetical protein
MTSAQAELLRRLIAADRAYRANIEAGGELVSLAERGVEVGWINGVNPRTAYSLEDAGLIELVDIFGNGHAWAFLGSYRP